MFREFTPKDGDIIEIIGHPNLDQGALRRVNTDGLGRLYVACNDGQIFLEGEFAAYVQQGFYTVTKCFG